MLMVATKKKNRVGEFFLKLSKVLDRLGAMPAFVDDIAHKNEEFILLGPMVFDKGFQRVNAAMDITYDEEIHGSSVYALSITGMTNIKTSSP
jgi:hypothetical protein